MCFCAHIISYVSHALGVSYTSLPWSSVCDYRAMTPNYFSFCYLWHGGLTTGCKRCGVATVRYVLVCCVAIFKRLLRLYVTCYLLLFVYEHHSLKENVERFVKIEEEIKKIVFQ